MICNKCAFSHNPDDAKFCGRCGARLERRVVSGVSVASNQPQGVKVSSLAKELDMGIMALIDYLRRHNLHYLYDPNVRIDNQIADILRRRFTSYKATRRPEVGRAIASIVEGVRRNAYKNGQGLRQMTMPNDPCPCGSGRLFKNCHGYFWKNR